MTVGEMTLDDLISEYQSFLSEKLNGDDITEIAFRIKKSVPTIYNYLSSEKDDKGKNKAKDFLTMKAIVELGLEILNKKGIVK